MSNLPEGFLNKLKQDNDESITYNSLKDGKVVVKQLSLKQQKDILSTAVDGIRGAVEFAKNINDIILENSDKKKLLVADKAPILLMLRQLSLGDTIEVEEEKLDISDFIKNLKEIKANFKFNSTIKKGDIILKLKVPTLKEESKILTKCITEVEKKKSGSTSDSFGIIYIYELIKYIDQVDIGEDYSLNFEDLKIADRVKVVENLPLSVYKELSKFFNDIDSYIKDTLTFNGKTINLDPSFFDAST